MTNSAEQNELSNQVGKAIAKATVKAFKLIPFEVIKLFDELKVSLLTDSCNDVQKLETQRRVAEAKVSVLADKNSFNEFEAAWGELESLGYSDLEREASLVFYRATFLIRNRIDKNLAEEAINRLDALISSFREKQLKHLVKHFTQVHNRLLNELNSTF